MKKIITLSISVILAFSLLVFATSCSFGDQFEKFSKEMQKNENYKMTLVFSVEGVGKITQYCYIDGKIAYYPENTALETEEYYVEFVDDYSIHYRKNEGGKWEKSIEENETNLETNDILNADNFQKDKEDKNVYRQKKNVVFDNYEDVVITFSEDTVVIECVMILDMVEYDVKILLSEIGEQDLTLPSVKS